MDFSTLYNIYSDAMDWGKMVVLKVFFDTLKGNPPLAVFFTCLLIRRPAKAAAEFIKRFV